MDMVSNQIKVYCLPDGACCSADSEKRNPLDIDECPIGNDICDGDCFYYREEDDKP